MKPVTVVLSVWAVTFTVATFFFLIQSFAGEWLHPSVARASVGVGNSNGNVLSDFTDPSFANTSVFVGKNEAPAGLSTIPHTGVFSSLLEKTGVLSRLSATGTYTFLAPSDEAFARSSLGPLAYLSAADKLRLAEYHIISGKMISLDSQKYGNMTMLSRDELNVSVFDAATIEANSHVVASYKVKNGIVYVIDIVLQPPQKRPFPF